MNKKKVVKPYFGLEKIRKDPAFVREFTDYLRRNVSMEERVALYARFTSGETSFDALMRSILVKSLLKKCGDGIAISTFVTFVHPETIEMGDGVFIGSYAMIQGRHDGRCSIGNKVWIGPHSFLDARALTIESYVGIGPGARILGSTHSGIPENLPIIQTDLIIKPVRLCRGSDIGMNAVILPGVTIGRGAIVGAGAVVTKNVQPKTIVAGVPAEILRKR